MIVGAPSATISVSGGGGGLTNTELRATPVPVTEAGSATAANQALEIASLSNIDGNIWNIYNLKLPTLVVGRMPVDGSGVTQPVSATALPLPTGAATETTLATLLSTAAFQARINTLGQKTAANSTPVTIASDQSAVPFSELGASTATVTAIPASALSVVLLAANPGRRSLPIIKNASTINRLFIKYGPLADTLSSYSDWIDPGATWVMMGTVYTGLITGIWAAVNLTVTGQALVTEITT